MLLERHRFRCETVALALHPHPSGASLASRPATDAPLDLPRGNTRGREEGAPKGLFFVVRNGVVAGDRSKEGLSPPFESQNSETGVPTGAGSKCFLLIEVYSIQGMKSIQQCWLAGPKPELGQFNLHFVPAHRHRRRKVFDHQDQEAAAN